MPSRKHSYDNSDHEQLSFFDSQGSEQPAKKLKAIESQSRADAKLFSENPILPDFQPIILPVVLKM
ncbi:hypothetical protein NDA01_30930 [Trichocoleus desertorum AS-A10]|uniref:hypothetical protein n=1 Tax=Trichocoleus desertorum TaxID=1481672 RepID=UPI003299E357